MIKKLQSNTFFCIKRAVFRIWQISIKYSNIINAEIMIIYYYLLKLQRFVSNSICSLVKVF